MHTFCFGILRASGRREREETQRKSRRRRGSPMARISIISVGGGDGQEEEGDRSGRDGK